AYYAIQTKNLNICKAKNLVWHGIFLGVVSVQDSVQIDHTPPSGHESSWFPQAMHALLLRPNSLGSWVLREISGWALANKEINANASCAIGYTRFFSNCMFSARPRISFVKTSKLAGVPASREFSPLTIDS